MSLVSKITRGHITKEGDKLLYGFQYNRILNSKYWETEKAKEFIECLLVFPVLFLAKYSKNARNFIGKRMGFSGCANCGDTWNWKTRHDTNYREGSSMFPLCEECYQILSPEKRFYYHKKLLDEWILAGLENDLKENYEKILKKIAEEVKYRV